MAEIHAQVLAEVQRIFKDELERDEPVLETHHLLHDLQVDSMAAIVLAVGLENRFRIKLTEADTDGVTTVSDLVERVAGRVRAHAGATS